MQLTICDRLKVLVNPSRRKLILFACSCVRDIWHLLDDGDSKKAIALAEAIGEGMVCEEEEIRRILRTLWGINSSGDEVPYNITRLAAYYTLSATQYSGIIDRIISAASFAEDASLPYQKMSSKQHQLDRISSAASFAEDASLPYQKMSSKQHQLFDDIFGI